MDPPPDSTAEVSATKYEEDHVHDVYEAIASHFSQTRYKPWPIVAEFLSAQPLGSIGLDAGSGNGKYLHGHNITSRPGALRSTTLPIGARDPQLLLHHEPRYFLIGLDRSLSLLSLTSNPNSDPDLLHGDCIRPPIRGTFAFDFAISIATLHHFSTLERRRAAMQSLLRAIRPSVPGKPGRLLVFVWAYEQGEKSRRKLEKGTLLPAEHLPKLIGDPLQASNEEKVAPIQDVLVPWLTTHQVAGQASPETMCYNRFYHLFQEGELIDLVHKAAAGIGLVHRAADDAESHIARHGWFQVAKHGWQADNWWVEVCVG